MNSSLWNNFKMIQMRFEGRSSSPPLLVSVTEQMLVIRKRNETSVVGQIADDLLAWVGSRRAPATVQTVITTFINTLSLNPSPSCSLGVRRRRRSRLQ